MFEPLEPDDFHKLKLESSGDGPGRKPRTAVGYEGDSAIDPTILAQEPPFWFNLLYGRIRKTYQKSFPLMEKDRALKILGASGMPPLCILSFGLRWNLLIDENFDYLDLQLVFKAAGHEVHNFGKFMDRLERRCLFYIYDRFGSDPHIFLNAPLSEF